MMPTDFSETAEERFEDRRRQYADTDENDENKGWFDRNYPRLKMLFENEAVSSYVFEPIADAWHASNPETDDKVRSIITKVAVANAVLAGLPGKLGVGVAVSMGLEAYMALCIARRLGLKIDKPSDVFKYFGVLAGVVGTILWLFRQLLGFAYSLFSIVPGLPPIVLAELFVTDIVGVLFWVGFEEAKNNGAFSIPKRLLVTFGKRAKELWTYQKNTVVGALSPSNVKLMAERVRAWLTGDILPTGREAAKLRGDAFCAGALAWLLMGREDQLQGPLGSLFIQSIRDRYPGLADASVPEIGVFMQESYDEDQLGGVLSLIKGKLFELLVEKEENADGDAWSAELHENQSYPGSDVIFTNPETGEIVEVSLKATESAGYIEETLLRYPDIPILTTSEMEEHFPDFENIMFADISNESLNEVTKDNFEELLEMSSPLDDADLAAGLGGTAAIGGGAAIWPFAAAYLRGRIDRDDLKRACKHILPRTGGVFAFRIILGACLGPIYAWYLLARMTMRMTPNEPKDQDITRSDRISAVSFS